MTATIADGSAVQQKHPLLGLAPGLALTAGIAVSAYGLRFIPAWTSSAR